MEAHDAGGIGIEHDLGLVGARQDQGAQPLGGVLRGQGRREVDPAHVEGGRFVGERPAEGPDAGLDRRRFAARVTGGAGGDHPKAGLAAAEKLGAALQAEAAVAQPRRRRALAGKGAGQEHHGVRGFALEFPQRLLRIEDDRDVDAARHQQGRQR